MLSSVLRYSLRWLLDVPPPFISAPVEGGSYIEIPGVRSEVYAKLRVIPEVSSQTSDLATMQSGAAGYLSDSGSDGSGLSAPCTPRAARASASTALAANQQASAAAKPKPSVVDHCTVLTADIPLSALVTYALRQIEVDTLFLERLGLPHEPTGGWEAWKVALDSAPIKNSLLLEVEAIQVSHPCLLILALISARFTD